MQATEILSFRDPQAQLKDIIMMQGYEDQKDQSLFDRIDSYTREVALDVLNLLELYIAHGHPIEQDELYDFILSDDLMEPVIETT